MLQDIEQKKYSINKQAPSNGLKYFVETSLC